MLLGILESMAIALFVMKKMRKQKTCVKSDRKNIMAFEFRVSCKVIRNGWIILCVDSGQSIAFT
jgi:hypothetical protein